MINCLAFDLGANSGRVSVASYDGKTISLREIRRFENAAVWIGSSLYWNLGMICDEFPAGICQALEEYPDLASVGIDSFCNDYVLISEDGDLMAPIRCYRDPRAARNEDAIYARMSKESIYKVSGNQIAPFNTLMQLAAIGFESKSDLLRDADNLLFLPDFLNFVLTGIRRTERTIASVTQMYDHKTKDWSDRVLEPFDIERRLFAPFVDAGTIIGEITDDVLPAEGIEKLPLVCAVPEHDTAAAFMAAPADENTLIISSGTWMIVGCETEKPIITDYGFRYNIANEGGIDGHHRLIRNLMGNWLLQELKRAFIAEGKMPEWDYGVMGEVAGNLPPWQWPIDVDLPTFYAPDNMREKISKVCVKIYGSSPKSPAEYTSSVCSGLALKTKWAAEKLETMTGRKFERVCIIGGGSRDKYTAGLIADATGLPVIMGPVEASLLGNAMFQLIALGKIKDVREGRELIKNSFEFTKVEPKATDEAAAAYEKFLGDFNL